MMKSLNMIVVLVFTIITNLIVQQATWAQNPGILTPVKWSSNHTQKGDEVTLEFTATLDKGWHLYSQFMDPDKIGPIPTTFTIQKSADFKLLGKVTEPKPIIKYDPNFDMDLGFFDKKVTFKQKIKVLTAKNFTLKADVEFMVCDDMRCLPPDIESFEFSIKGVEVADSGSENGNDKDSSDARQDTALVEEVPDTSGLKTLDEQYIKKIIPDVPLLDLENPVGSCGEGTKDVRNLWLVFIFGFTGGLLALLTPCVFPMIPLTVSFFTKGAGNEGSKGIFRAVLYGFFIFAIYAILSIPFHFNTDPEVLNEIATSVWLNVLFFVIFIVFAISFFGFFEITMPSKWANKANSASNIGGLLGIFFMALTLALVSFSCTGPILGTVLGSSLKNGPWPITMAMSGFGVALGLPFALFAAFPRFLNKLPQSGGWMTSVKVVLGFIEIALAIKFLSNADLVEQWGLIKRETFFLLWILTGLGLTLYLFGFLRFPHHSPSKKKPSYFKVVFTAAVLAFTVYLVPGVMKNPAWNHDLLSGFPPPGFYSWYDKESFHAEYTDFDEAMKRAKEENKPILIDFTGWACVNCRKMEETVWTVGKVKKVLEEDYILVSLYVDDKNELPEEYQGVYEINIDGKIKKKRIRTIGNKWATFQTHMFNNNSQPYYVALSPDGVLLSNPVGYVPDVENYYSWLQCSLDAFKNSGEEK